MKILLVTILLTISPLFATTQESELWIVNGRQVYCNNFPHIEKILSDHKIPEFGHDNTGNYKGYTASWAVINDQLYLVGIEAVLVDSKDRSYNNQVLKDVKFPLMVTSWSGTVSNQRSVTDLLPDTEDDSYNEVTTITFKKGRLVSSVYNQRKPIVKSKKANKAQ